MLQTLTQEQKRVLKEIDRLIDFGTTPKRIYLKETNFKIFMQIMHKKKKFPASLNDIPLEEDVYRGIKICPWPPHQVKPETKPVQQEVKNIENE